MTNFDTSSNDMLFLIVTASGRVLETEERIKVEQAAGWQVRVIATPQAAEWLDRQEIERLTGFGFESKMLTPEASTLSPLGSRVLASPLTLNSVTKWADGHADNLALGLLCEALGSGVPIRAEVRISEAFANHPALRPALQRLDDAGVELDVLASGRAAWP